MSVRHFTIWQCTDWCCYSKPYSERWWNVGVAPGNYNSRPTWSEAVSTALSGRLWDLS